MGTYEEEEGKWIKANDKDLEEKFIDFYAIKFMEFAKREFKKEWRR